VGDIAVNQILKPDIMGTELVLDQLVEAGTRPMALIEGIAPSQQSRGALARPMAASPSRPLQAADLRRLLKLRGRQRRKATGQFLDWPAWDMLLDLAAVRAESGHISVSAVCISSGAPQSTALRKLAALESAGLIRRYLHGTDRRRVCLALTDEGAEFVTGAMAEEVAFFQDARC
jgi:DNA-binding MarR family transcriptional regulator